MNIQDSYVNGNTSVGSKEDRGPSPHRFSIYSSPVKSLKSIPSNSQTGLLNYDMPKDVVFTRPTLGFQEVNIDKYNKDQNDKKVLLNDLAQ